MSGSEFTGPNLNIRLTCPECRIFPPDLIERFSEGDIVCGSCGLVLSDRVVDTRSEWRTFSNDDQNGDDPSRVGDAGNPLLDTEDLSTMISYVPENTKVGRELNRAQSKSLVDKKDNALAAAYAKIGQMCDGYQLPKIVQDAAKEVYKLVYDERLLRGKSQELIMAAAIFIGCRRANVARSFKEIWALTNVPRKEIGKVFKIMNTIIREKNASSMYFTPDNIQTTQTSAEDLIRRFCSHLGVSVQVTNAAEHIARRCKEVGVLAGRSPITIAATVIYMAAQVFNTDLQPSKIADKTGVSDGTIKTSFKVMWEEREKLIDPLWKESGKIKLTEPIKV
ncbi:transcription initiation factor IIB [Scheffersomyces spartinae]|uniref:Transcription initiation factor IIB n=1 Tax=Scheffersomyces spartinae TaxID=45513 RepID=A0A9P7V6Y3_9ASCO|nr:transcription initiation factor IIB [Scheffersomyces spartinae]KAG7192409.1 transcription initiation factor IIB [Scheffersomyces spartinae]